jgi:hypothetical protein
MARAAKPEADAVIAKGAKQRAEIVELRAKLAEDERRVDEKLARARGLFELASALHNSVTRAGLTACSGAPPTCRAWAPAQGGQKLFRPLQKSHEEMLY